MDNQQSVQMIQTYEFKLKMSAYNSFACLRHQSNAKTGTALQDIKKVNFLVQILPVKLN